MNCKESGKMLDYTQVRKAKVYGIIYSIWDKIRTGDVFKDVQRCRDAAKILTVITSDMKELLPSFITVESLNE